MKKFVIIIITSLLIVGCSKPSNTTQGIIDNVEDINAAADEIAKLHQDVKPKTEEIKTKANEIKDTSQEIDKTNNSNVKELQNTIVAKEKELTSINKEIIKLKNENSKLINSLLTWAILASTIGFGVCLALFFLGNLKSITLSIIFAAVIGSCIAVQFVLKYQTYIIAIIGIPLIGSLIYLIFIKKRAIKELVVTGEVVKKEIGKDHFKEIVNKDNIQSKTTKEIVDQEQRKLNDSMRLAN